VLLIHRGGTEREEKMGGKRKKNFTGYQDGQDGKE
jgi:hypothetical protein